MYIKRRQGNEKKWKQTEQAAQTQKDLEQAVRREDPLIDMPMGEIIVQNVAGSFKKKRKRGSLPPPIVPIAQLIQSSVCELDSFRWCTCQFPFGDTVSSETKATFVVLAKASDMYGLSSVKTDNGQVVQINSLDLANATGTILQTESAQNATAAITCGSIVDIPLHMPGTLDWTFSDQNEFNVATDFGTSVTPAQSHWVCTPQFLPKANAYRQPIGGNKFKSAAPGKKSTWTAAKMLPKLQAEFPNAELSPKPITHKLDEDVWPHGDAIWCDACKQFLKFKVRDIR